MRFLGSKFTQNALAAGAPLRTPLLELKRFPRPLADFRGRFAAGERERGERGRRERGKGYWGRERGREGKRRGEGGKGEGGGKGRVGGVCVTGVGGIDVPVNMDH